MMKDKKWNEIDNCAYPDIEIGCSSVNVWVIADYIIQYATYYNPEMDVCWFEIDGYRDDDVVINYWQEVELPDPPKGF